MRKATLWLLIGLHLLLGVSLSAEEAPAPVTAILGAFEEEVVLLQGHLQDRQEKKILGIPFSVGELNGRRVVVARTGVGKVNAGMTTTLLIEHFRPSEVIFSGVAGGLNPKLSPGDIVLATTTVQHDLGNLTVEGFTRRAVRSPVSGERNPVYFPADGRLLDLAQKCARQVDFDRIEAGTESWMPRVVVGTVASGDCFVALQEKKEELHKSLGADAVEMEGAAVAQVCWQLGVPCLVIRSLSDRSDARASEDFEKFYRVAARNSSRLVMGLVEKLKQDTSIERRDGNMQ